MCEVGCAIAACPYKLPIVPFYTYLDYLYLPYYKLPTPYLVVCNFGPGNPDPYQPPYINATSCSYCPDEYPLCTNSTENEDSTRRTRMSRTRVMPPSPPGEPRIPRDVDSDEPRGQTGMTVDETGMTVDASGSGSGDEDDFRQIGLCCKMDSGLTMSCLLIVDHHLSYCSLCR